MKVYLLVCGRDLHFPFNIGLVFSLACGPFSSLLFCAPEQDMHSLAFASRGFSKLRVLLIPEFGLVHIFSS